MKKNKLHYFFVVLILSLGFLLTGISKTNASSTGIVSATVQLALCGDGIKDTGEQCDGGDLNGRLCSSLGFNGGSLGCSASCEFEVSACTTNANVFSHVVLNPNADRTYILSDGLDSVGIDFIQYFYPTDISLFIFSNPVATTTIPDQSGVGRFFNLVFVNENGDVVHKIDKTSTLTLTYADIDLGSTDEDTISPYRSEDNGNTWQAIPAFTLNKINKTITFTTIDFSTFSIFGYPLVIRRVNATGGGGGIGGGSGDWAAPKATPEEKKAILKIADFNKDGRVDVVDLSILLYYFDHTDAKIKQYDLNGDGKIDLIDVSIMLYYWEITS
jgi:hypothetical protein